MTTWIARRPWIAVSGIALGLSLLALGYITSQTATLSDGPPGVQSTWFYPNWAIIVPGLLLLVLSVCVLAIGVARRLRPAKPVGRNSLPVDR